MSNRPSARIGVASNLVSPEWHELHAPAISGSAPPCSFASPVLYVQATCRLETLSRFICVSGEYRVPPGSPPYAGHSE